MRIFLALQTFSSPETRSTYVTGMTYTIRPKNRYLNALAEVWALEGKVNFIAPPTVSKLRGHGYTEPGIWAKTVTAWRQLWR